MPSIAQYENAIRKAMAAGDDEAADYLRQKLGAAKEESYAKDELAKMNPLERGLAGAGHGALKMWRNMANLVGAGNALPGAGDMDNAASKALRDTTAGSVGGALGEAGALAPVGMGVGGAVTRAVGGAAAPWLGAAAGGAAEGFAGGEEGHRLEGATIGTLAAPATMGAMKLGGKVLDATGIPTAVKSVLQGYGKPTEAAQRLLDQGVPLTTGQRLGPASSFNKLEEAAQSLPGAGAKIRAGREAANTEVNELQRAFSTPPTAPGQPGSLARGLGSEEANAGLMDLYQQAYSRVNGWPMQPVTGHPGSAQSRSLVDAALDAAKSNVGELPMGERARARDFMLKELSGLKPNKQGHVTSDDLLDVRERVRAEVRDLLANPDSNVDVKKARIYNKFLDDLTTGIKEQLPAAEAKFLDEVDRHYASYAPLKAASIAQNRTLGVGNNPSPSQVLRGVQASMSPSDIAAGNYRFPNQQLARDAAEVIPTRAPATGERVATLAPLVKAGAPLTAGGAALGGAVAGPVGAGIGGTAGASVLPKMLEILSTNPTAQRMMTGQMAHQPFFQKLAASRAAQEVPASIEKLAEALAVQGGLSRWRERNKKKTKKED